MVASEEKFSLRRLRSQPAAIPGGIPSCHTGLLSLARLHVVAQFIRRDGLVLSRVFDWYPPPSATSTTSELRDLREEWRPRIAPTPAARAP